MKKFVAGLVIGLLIASISPIKAAIEEYICYKADYTLIINGTQYDNPDLPILNYQGYTYGPLRSMLEAAGLNVNWNADLGQAEVMSPEIITDTSPSPTPEPLLSSSIPATIEFDNSTIVVNSITYVSEYKSSVCPDGQKYAIINMDIFVNDPPETSLEWFAVRFVETLKIDSGSKNFIITSYDTVKHGLWKNTDIAAKIYSEDNVTSIVVKDPISLQTAEVLFNNY